MFERLDLNGYVPTWAACFDFQDEGDQAPVSMTLDIPDGKQPWVVLGSATVLMALTRLVKHSLAEVNV